MAIYSTIDNNENFFSNFIPIYMRWERNIRGVIVSHVDIKTVLATISNLGQEEFERSLRDVLEWLLKNRIGKIIFQTGADLVLPDWFIEKCKALGIQIEFIPTEYSEKSFFDEYIPAYGEFEKSLVDAICYELNLSTYIAEMGKAYFGAFCEIIEQLGQDDVFEEQNEKLRTEFERKWLPYLLGMAKTNLPELKIEDIIRDYEESRKNNPNNPYYDSPDYYVFDELDCLLREHFGA